MTIDDIIKKISGYENLDLYDNQEYMQMWLEWYRGKSEKFHSYKIYNGKNFIPMDRFSLGMGKRVCEDWANLLINEKTDVVVGDEASQNTLNDILRKCKFWKKANEGLEKTFALGTGAFVVRVDKIPMSMDGYTIIPQGEVNVSFVNGQKIRPITIEDGEITECAFINIGSKETNISIHLKDESGNYRIHNIVAHGRDGENLIYDDKNDYYIFDTKNTIPWFAIIKPNISNNIDINSPLGISIFANNIDTLKEIDLIYDSFANEFALGRKRIFINARNSVINMKNGEQQEVFDSNDVAIYVLPEDDDGKTTMWDNTQTLRVADHQTGIQTQLNLLSYACGFGTNHYKFDGGSVATATQIVSENSDLFRNLKKHEIIIEDALITVMNAIVYAANTFTQQRINAGTSIEIQFDDSIIEDKQGEKANDRIDVSMGVMSKAEFRSKWYGETLEVAQRKIDEINNLTITDEDMFEEEEQIQDAEE